MRRSQRGLFDMMRPKAGTNCITAARALQRHLDGDLDAATDATLLAHLEACKGCGLDAAAYSQIKLSLAREADPVAAETVNRLRAFANDIVNRYVPKEGS